MMDAYNTIIEKDVWPAFMKFDKDGSGSIDKYELKDLSELLGHNLEDQDLDAALLDLDINKDGVIDFDEFKRWYFTGMKSYNNSTRNMMKVGGAAKSFLDHIKGEEISEILKAEKYNIQTHKFEFKFNG